MHSVGASTDRHIRAAGDDEVVPCSAAGRRAVLAAAILGSGMAFIDGTVANVALPAIQRDLGASAFQAQWVIESYALVLAALLLVGGALGDRFGRRRVFAIGTALFAVASAGCGLAASVHGLIAARALQGVGAALMVPGSLALISAVFPRQERGRAIGTWSGASAITAAVGPVLGGWLIDHASWTWAFFINLPFAALVLWLCWRHVPESRRPQAGRLDIIGAVLATLGLAGIVFAFIEAPATHWLAPPVVVAAAVGVLATVGFFVQESRSPAPMLPLAMLRIRNFAGANLLTLLLYAGLSGGLYFFPLALIQVQGASATLAGAALLPFALILTLFSNAAGRLADRVGPRLMLVTGPLIAAVGFALFALPGVGADYWRGYLPAVVVLGIGMTITVAPLTATVMNAAGPESAGVASGVNNAVSRVAGVLAIAVFGLVMALVFDARLRADLQTLAVPPEAARALYEQRHQLAAAQPPAGLPPEQAQALRDAVRDAFIAGFRWVMGVSAGLALLSALAAWRWIGRGDLAGAESGRRP